ncbi:MAG: PP2C family protein-serine/threonine phosphatase [Marinilabiliales bacterium]
MGNKASLRRLKLSNYKLNTLLDITLAINDNASTNELLSRYENIIRKELNIGKLMVFSYNQKWETILTSGLSKEQLNNINIDVERDLLKYQEITNISVTSKEGENIAIFDVIIPVFHKNTPLAYVLIGDIEEERSGISPTIKHLHFIQTLTNVIIVAIENKRLYKETLRQEAIKKELELASQMQSMLIPSDKTLPDNDFLKVRTFYKPHSEVGGDYYDFIVLNENEVGFCIADVSGKGISAALLMSNFQASLRALFTGSTSLKQLVKKLNEIVMTNTKGEKFITIFIAKYNYKTKNLKYINAGHNPPVLYNKNKIKYLKTGCIGLGMFREIPVIKEGLIKINCHTKLLCYTDGLVEVENKKNKEFGTLPIEKALMRKSGIEEDINTIIKKLYSHKEDQSFFDDISIIGLEFF